MEGMTREATQELGCLETPGVTGRVCNKTRSKEVAPEVGGALGRACAILDVEEFVNDVGLDAAPDDSSCVC